MLQVRVVFYKYKNGEDKERIERPTLYEDKEAL